MDFNLIKKQIQERKINSLEEIEKAVMKLKGETIKAAFNDMTHHEVIELMMGEDFLYKVMYERFRVEKLNELAKEFRKAQKSNLIVTGGKFRK